MFLCSWSGLVSPLLFLFIVCFELLLTPEVAVEHLSVSPSPSSWANVEARPESSVLARLENKNFNGTTFCEDCVLVDMMMIKLGNVEARPESSVLARLWNKLIMRPFCCC